MYDFADIDIIESVCCIGSAFLAHGYRFFCPTNDFYPTVFFVFQTFNLSYSVTLTHGIYLRIFFDTYMIDLTDICFGFVFTCHCLLDQSYIVHVYNICYNII